MKLKLVVLLCIIISAVTGYYLGALCLASEIPYITWLGKGLNFGFDAFSVDLSFVQFTIGLHMDFNFLQIFLTVILCILSPKIADALPKGKG